MSNILFRPVIFVHVMLQRIFKIIGKDIKVEMRQGHAIAGVFLFAVTVVFIVFKSFNNFTRQEWSLLLWIIVIFAGLNAVVKSFLQEDAGTYLYYHFLFDPVELIIAKFIYNFGLLSVLFSIITVLMMMFGGNPIADAGLFVTGSFLGVLGLAVVFTLVSSIASAGNNVSTLMSILALPLILPVLLSLIKITAVSLRLIGDTDVNTDLLLLLGIDGMMIGAGILLFPLIWKA